MIVFYALKFPQIRLAFMMRWGFVWFRWIRLPAWFALVPEHILPEIERPVATIGETLVVEKLGPGREVAEETAP